MSTNPFGSQYDKYWDKRYKYFSKFDEGVQMDPEGLFSVCPEDIAHQIARKANAKIVVDAFCGVGGNTIAFAQCADKVYALDTNSDRLKMAEHNSTIYGVNSKIEFVNANFLEKAKELKADTVFLDPPWGGPDYSKLEKFGLSNFSPDGKEILAAAFENFTKVILRVPKNFDFSELEYLGKEYDLEDNILDERVISQTIYFK